MKFRASPLAAALALACLVAVCASEARAQQTCPQIAVECPDMVEKGEELVFRAVVAEADPSLALTFDWEVSGGTITSGHGTAEIRVDRTGFEGQVVTVTVTVGGLPDGCEGTSSCTTSAGEEVAEARLFDSYGKLNFEGDSARLDNFFDALQNEPGAQGYIVVYAGRRARAGEAAKRGDRAKSYLIDERKLEGDRLVIMDGGFRDEFTVELFVVPTGAPPPEASPTVDPSEVEIIPEEKPKPKPARKPSARTTPAPKSSGAKPKP